MRGSSVASFVRLYRDSGGGDRPVQGGLKVCWDTDAGQARKTMHRLWPNEAIPGESAQLLPLPRHTLRNLRRQNFPDSRLKSTV